VEGKMGDWGNVILLHLQWDGFFAMAGQSV
jgi:hypothetical protein